MKTSRIFVSYAHEDVDLASKITQKLHEKGVPTWFPYNGPRILVHPQLSCYEAEDEPI